MSEQGDYAVNEAVGGPVDDRPRRRLGGLQRRADQIRGLAAAFLSLSLIAGATACTDLNAASVMTAVAILAAAIGLGLWRQRPLARVAAAIALHLVFAFGLLALPERGLLADVVVAGCGFSEASGPSLLDRLLTLAAMAVSLAGLWTLLSSPSHRIFDGELGAGLEGVHPGRSLYFWLGFAALTAYLRDFVTALAFGS